MLRPLKRFGWKVVASGFVLGLVAAAGAVLTAALADDPPRLPGAPSGSLLPGEPSAPQGSVDVTSVVPGKAVMIGRFRILPAGSVPTSEYGLFPTNTKAGLGVEYGDRADPVTLAKAAALGVSVNQLTAPSGFKLKYGGGGVITTTEGKSYLSEDFYEFTRDDQFPLSVSIRLIKPGSVVELVDYYEGVGFANASLNIDGNEVVVVHGTPDAKVQPVLEAWFTIGDYLFYIEAPALPPGIFGDFLQTTVREQTIRLLPMSAAAIAAASPKEDRP
jgi:hypothetical protein